MGVPEYTILSFRSSGLYAGRSLGLPQYTCHDSILKDIISSCLSYTFVSFFFLVKGFVLLLSLLDAVPFLVKIKCTDLVGRDLWVFIIIVMFLSLG